MRWVRVRNLRAARRQMRLKNSFGAFCAPESRPGGRLEQSQQKRCSAPREAARAERVRKGAGHLSFPRVRLHLPRSFGARPHLCG